MKTNSEYRDLAYEHAILQDTIAMLARTYLPDEGGDSPKTLLCEQVLHSEAEVPEGAFLRVLSDLEERCVALKREMAQFELKRTTDGRQEEATKQSPSATRQSSANKKGSKAGSKTSRSTRAKRG